MIDISKAGTFTLGDRTVKRLGYGAMQLAGPGVFGPPKDRDAALAVLREAVASGVDHIDTSDFYGPHVTNQIIREALHPYPDDLVIVTKIGARRGEDASWNPGLLGRRTDQRGARQPAQPGPGRARCRQPAPHVRRPRACRGLDRGAAHRSGGASATRAGPSYRPQQRDIQAGRGRARHHGHRLRAEPVQYRAPPRRCADRRTRHRGHRLCAVLSARRFHAAASRRHCPMSPNASVPHRCR